MMDRFSSYFNEVAQLIILMNETVYQYIKVIYSDIVLSNNSVLWLILLLLWSIIVIIKYISMSYFGIIWCIKRGQEYHDYLYNHPQLTGNVIKEADEKFNRKPIGLGPWVKNLVPRLGNIIFFLYRMPIIFMGTALLIGIFVLLRQPKGEILFIINLLLIGLSIQVTLRYAYRLYLGRYADIDESVTLTGNTDVVDEGLLRYLSFRRVVFLYMIDILIFLFCFSFIHLGIHYYYNYKAYEGVESNNCFRQLVDFIYFTLITFTTTGFGDIVPSSECIWARAVTSIQIFLGFLYVVGLILLLSLTTRAEPFISNKKNDR